LAQLRPDVISAGTEIWAQLIGRDGVQPHLNVASTLLRRAAKKDSAAALETIVQTVVAAAWDTQLDAKARELELKAATEGLLAQLVKDAALPREVLEPVFGQFTARIWNNSVGLRRARTRLNPDLTTHGLTERQIECVTQRLWENTISRFSSR
jgi:hypothetical protein